MEFTINTPVTITIYHYHYHLHYLWWGAVFRCSWRMISHRYIGSAVAKEVVGGLHILLRQGADARTDGRSPKTSCVVEISQGQESIIAVLWAYARSSYYVGLEGMIWRVSAIHTVHLVQKQVSCELNITKNYNFICIVNLAWFIHWMSFKHVKNFHL